MMRDGPRRCSVSAAALTALLLSLNLAGCGGSSHPATSTTKATGGPATRAAVHATLTGQNHDPVARKNWSYNVSVADSQGRPLSGTVETDFAFQGTVVGHETPRIHHLKHGGLHDTLQFPAMAVGYPIELQVVVRTPAGSVTLDWPVTVKK